MFHLSWFHKPKSCQLSIPCHGLMTRLLVLSVEGEWGHSGFLHIISSHINRKWLPIYLIFLRMKAKNINVSLPFEKLVTVTARTLYSIVKNVYKTGDFGVQMYQMATMLSYRSTVRKESQCFIVKNTSRQTWACQPRTFHLWGSTYFGEYKAIIYFRWPDDHEKTKPEKY